MCVLGEGSYKSSYEALHSARALPPAEDLSGRLLAACVRAGGHRLTSALRVPACTVVPLRPLEPRLAPAAYAQWDVRQECICGRAGGLAVSAAIFRPVLLPGPPPGGGVGRAP